MDVKNFLVTVARRSWKAIAVISLMIFISLLGQGELDLMGGVVIGYMLGIFYFISVTARLNKIMLLIRDPVRARREMIFGMLMRLVMIFLCLMLVIKISTKLFFSATTGFLVVFFVVLFYISKISLENRIGRR